MRYFKIGKISKLLGVTPQTVRSWYKSGKIEGKRTESGRLLFPESILVSNLNKIEKINVGYCRVSSRHQKDDLERQKQIVKLFLSQKDREYTVIDDIGSGINYKKQGLLELIQKIVSGQVNTLVILNKDRLIRFGYELIEYICSLYSVRIEIIDDKLDKSYEEELVDDLLSIVTVYSAKLNGKRSHIRKKLMEKLNEKENDLC